MRSVGEIITSILDQHRTGYVSDLGGALSDLVWTARRSSDGKMLASFVLTGQVKSGKNNMQTTKTGRHYPLPSWAAWRDQAVWEIKSQGPIRLIQGYCTIHIDYAGEDLRRRDVPGMEDALFHCLERAGVVQDDSQFKECHWWHSIDRENARARIRIYALGDA